MLKLCQGRDKECEQVCRVLVALSKSAKASRLAIARKALRICRRVFMVVLSLSFSLSRPLCMCGHRYGQSSELFYSSLCIFTMLLLSYSSAIIIFTAYFSRFIFIHLFVRTFLHSFLHSIFVSIFLSLLSLATLLTTFSRAGFRLTTKYQYYLKRC